MHVTIADNRISHDHFGVWLGINGNVKAALEDNSFHDVSVHVFTFS